MTEWPLYVVNDISPGCLRVLAYGGYSIHLQSKSLCLNSLGVLIWLKKKYQWQQNEILIHQFTLAIKFRSLALNIKYISETVNFQNKYFFHSGFLGIEITKNTIYVFFVTQSSVIISSTQKWGKVKTVIKKFIEDCARTLVERKILSAWSSVTACQLQNLSSQLHDLFVDDFLTDWCLMHHQSPTRGTDTLYTC